VPCSPVKKSFGSPTSKAESRAPSLGHAQSAIPGWGQLAAQAEQQRIAQETDAARTSRLFATTNAREHPTSITSPNPATTDQGAAAQTGRSEAPALDPDSLLNMQDRKVAFVTAAVDRKTVSPDRLTNPASRYVVQAGAVISAALITGIRSDLPGQVTAQVTENVYDTPTGRYLLIPQGSKLVGTYDSQVSFGQDRVLLVWTRLIMPNGRCAAGGSERARRSMFNDLSPNHRIIGDTRVQFGWTTSSWSLSRAFRRYPSLPMPSHFNIEWGNP
jgi:type IV secretory pathway VirB10-like protein